MHGQFAFCCDCQPPYRRDVVLIFVVIIFQVVPQTHDIHDISIIEIKQN